MRSLKWRPSVAMMSKPAAFTRSRQWPTLSSELTSAMMWPTPLGAG